MQNRVGFLVLTLLLGGCYTTKVYTGAVAYGPETRDRQWFTLGGLVSLSDPAGQQCPAGVARAESELAGVDILINIGLGIAGGIAGAAACSASEAGPRALCAASAGNLLPFLFGSRTVRYVCAGTGVAPGGWAPPPGMQQAPPAPYYPPPPGAPGPYPPPPPPARPPG